MKEFDIEYWDYKDGSIGAFINTVPGNIWAQDASAFASGMKHIMDIFSDHADARDASGETSGVFDLKAEAMWIEGRLCARWLAVPGFGIDFASEEEVQEFIKALMIPPDPKKYKAKMN